MNLLDGAAIKIFKHKAGDSTTISNNYIKDIKEDAAGNIWIATAIGLNRFNKKLQRLSNYYLGSSPYGTSAIINSLQIDGTIIWCGTDAGLFKFTISNSQNVFLECGKNEILPKRIYCNKINCVVIDENKICWLCTSEGVWSFNTKNNIFKKEIAAANDKYYNPLFLTAINDGDKLWAGCWQYGLKLLDKKTGKVTNYFTPKNYTQPVLSIAKVLQPDGSNLLWLNGDLNAFNPATATFLQFKKPLLLPDYPHVKANYVSNDNWVWTITDKGLYVYNPQRQIFNNLVFDSAITSQQTVIQSMQNNLLVCGEGQNIFSVYDSSEKLIKSFSNFLFLHNPSKKNSAAALNIIKENDNRWWLTTSEGIVNFDLATGSTKWFEHKDDDSTSIPRNFINDIFLDSKKQLWIFPWRGGVWQMDTLTGKSTKIFDGFTSAAGIKKKLVIADVAEDEQGNLWLCDLDEGIIFYDRKTGNFTKPFSRQVGNGVHNSRIYKHAGYYYSVSNNTIVKWKDKNDCITINFPAEIDKFVYDFVPDLQGNWWFTTKNGLIFFNEEKNIFKRFTTADGLYSNDLDGTIHCMPNGKIIIGGLSYVTAFFPQKIVHTSPQLPQLLLRRFTANGNAVDFSSAGTAHLSYSNNNIVFEWALPDYTSPFRNRYYCRLQGIDSNWRYVGNKGEVQYANLSPGNYTILLRAANANGDFTNENITVHFFIHPPFWKTLWFLLGCLAVITALIYILFKRRINSVKKKIELQQQMVELEMKALRAQMNPHFIFNSLNSIQECIVSKNTDAAYNYLSQFSKLVRRILENSGKETVPLKEEQELMQWYLSLEQLRFTDEFVFNIENNCSNPQTEIPSMIIQPFIENALWHGLINKQGQKKIQLIFNDDKEGINIQIIDNGIGRKAAALVPQRVDKQSMGLGITKERLKNYSHASSIEIIDLLGEYANAGGTKVIIHLPYN